MANTSIQALGYVAAPREDNRCGSMCRPNSDHRGKPSTTFHYEIANLTSYGGDTGFPITTEATLWDLRLTHRSASGVVTEVPLYDETGLRQIDLDTRTLFLRSDNIDLPEPGERVELHLRGKVRPTRLSAGNGRESRDVTAYSGFSLEVPLVLGLYEALHITDERGTRYAVGTLCLRRAEEPLEDDAFGALRRAVGVQAIRTGRRATRRRVGSR